MQGKLWRNGCWIVGGMWVNLFENEEVYSPLYIPVPFAISLNAQTPWAPCLLLSRHCSSVSGAVKHSPNFHQLILHSHQLYVGNLSEKDCKWEAGIKTVWVCRRIYHIGSPATHKMLFKIEPFIHFLIFLLPLKPTRPYNDYLTLQEHLCTDLPDHYHPLCLPAKIIWLQSF